MSIILFWVGCKSKNDHVKSVISSDTIKSVINNITPSIDSFYYYSNMYILHLKWYMKYGNRCLEAYYKEDSKLMKYCIDRQDSLFILMCFENDRMHVIMK